ncbi:Nonribosomal peptide synthase atnA [Colletotrichum sidae]|uniref:Nonribosomal peptide synthase atnA n=1 Tax=Colletotrichum sidae TaxID=1347389 RepID=A0A4R8TGW7_9PEZI|nr:Nonribosomal peptide synthase atnA [Colletotrichum sidae]
MVAQHVQATPSSLAVDAWDRSFTYAELDDASSRVAAKLIETGIGPDCAVALVFEKGAWNTVATLGVLKAGGAFLPIDPSQPERRITRILQEAQVKVILSSKFHEGSLLAISDNIITLDDIWLQSVSTTPVDLKLPSPKPWDLAYIMFTSGSTGEPKGVMIEHSACSSSVVAHGKATGFNRQTRAIQYARHTFDASIAEILTTLAFGGCVVVPSEEARVNDISAFICDKKVNWAFFTPSVIRLLDPYTLSGLKTVVLGGEALGQDNVDAWAPGRRLIVGYGPTENTVFSTMHEMLPGESASTIGRGTGTACWITDPEDPTRLYPVGAVGELLLESPQLARGYLNFEDGEGPNRAFVRDPPWLTRLGRRARLYRTGDLCRFDENGIIHYEGRKDTQLKISGQRLEASEVEHHLRRAFATSEVVVDVLARPSPASAMQSKALVAFFSLKKRTEVALNATEFSLISRPDTDLQALIRRAEADIGKALPSWMCPSIYIPLDGMPLSSNGKIDGKRLRQEFGNLSPEQLYSLSCTEPTSRSEETPELRLMRQLWVEVLGLGDAMIQADSHFFRLGGDSLAAMGLVAAARKRGLELSFAQIFRNPVLVDLASLPAEREQARPTARPLELLGSNPKIIDDVLKECGVTMDDIEDIFPCTPLQEGLMALSSTTSNSFMVQYVLHLPEDIDIAALESAWEKVSQAHGILRTRLVDTAGFGIQQVVVTERLAWNESSNLEEYLELDLTKDSGFGDRLNRFGVVYDANGIASQLVWTVHHAVVDGHSAGLTLRAVRNAFMGAPLPPQASFSSFIKYQRRMDTAAAGEYWTSMFQGGDYNSFPKKPSFASTDCEPAHRHTEFVRRHIRMPPRGTGITATTLLRAAWGLVIGRFSGSRDAVFGMTSSGRNVPFHGIEDILGPTIATVPLRVTRDESTTVRNFLEDIQATLITMIPFEQMGVQNIARLNEACRTACNFQSIMIVQPEVDMAVDGTPFAAVDRPQDIDKFNSHAVMLECSLLDGGAKLNVNYDVDYLDRLQMERLVDYFEAAVLFLSENDATLLDEFLRRPTVSDMDQMREWNGQIPQTVAACVHELFEQQAGAQPNAEAVFAWDGSLTFRELDEKASQLARVLHELGVGPEKKVAYCFEKSLYTVVSMLAILKAGGAMVPLDPAHPAERKSFVVQNIAADVVLASEAQADLLGYLGVQVVVVNAGLFHTLEDVGICRFSSLEARPHHAATVLFTSGSTGTPKGVVQEHRTLCSAAFAHADGMEMSSRSRILQFSSHVFDVSIIEIVNALVLGACLCIPSDEERTNDLAGFITRSQADWAYFTPSFARTLDPADVPSLKTICMGGEAMTPDNIQLWASSVSLINAYGPCEGSVCTVANLSKGHVETDSIGRGLNTLVWIVDPENHDRLLPIGSIGEILIEGPSVAREYLGDEQRTNMSFINPEWAVEFNNGEPARRMYKTGDLGKFNRDGSISYLGRKDFQIKLRGQRVEPGEIEHHLNGLLPSGSRAVVDAVTLPGSNSKSLAAFVEFGGGRGGAESEAEFGHLADQLRARLSIILPAYMVPSSFMPMDSIPLGPTGKLDRGRLREYASKLTAPPEVPSSQGETVQDGNALRAHETVALSISNKVADLLSAGDHRRHSSLQGSDFNPFHAGMDSIQVISLSTFVRKTFGVSLPIQKYMNSSATIRDIARWIVYDRRVSEDEAGAVDLLQEIEKYDEPLAALPLPTAENRKQDTPHIVMLTGATGFLGNQLLAQLLQRGTVRKVIALVRGEHPAHAAERLLTLARGSSSWWREDYANRIEVWHGDLALPRLGLREAQWTRLTGSSVDAEPVDAVIHNGAVVNWMADYPALTAANIMSTVNLLTALTEAAAASRPVRLAYVSGGHLSTLPDDTQAIARELKTYPAYSQTKFVAEVLVSRYAERAFGAGHGRLVSIIKPGLILGSSSDGVSNTDDFLWRVTASALDVGLFNDGESDEWMAAAGVDLVAGIVLDGCFDGRPDEDPHHQRHHTTRKILAGLTMSDYWSIVAEETGRVARPTETGAWLRSVGADVQREGPSHRLWPVMHFLEDKRGKLGQPLGAMTARDRVEHQDSVRRALRASLRYLVAIGYIKSSRPSSVDGNSVSDVELAVPRPVVFSRTPTTPTWNHELHSNRLGYKDGSGLKSDDSLVVRPLRTPSPL